MIKPPRLAPGDTLAVVSLSWGGPAAFPAVFDRGLGVLRDHFGFRIREYPTARLSAQDLYQDPQRRAADLNQAFADPEVKGIVSSIGGNDSIRILEHLDLDVIRDHPKLLMGYSDATAYLAYLNLLGLVTFYGPGVMTGWAYLDAFPEALEEYRRVLFSPGPQTIEPFSSWSDQYQDWSRPENAGRLAVEYRHDTAHHWLQTGPTARGRLWGGCLEVLEMMKGTFAWPSVAFWSDRVLFLETSEEKPTPAQVGYALRNYGVQGVLQRIQGLVLGKPKSYTDAERQRLDAEVLKVVGEFGRPDLNIVTNVDLGHTDPRHLFPYGVLAELGEGRLRFVESPFAP